MMGASATSLSTMMNTKIDISPPEAELLDLALRSLPHSYPSAEPLPSDSWTAAGRRPETARQQALPPSSPQPVPLNVTVELGRTSKSISEILDFAPGSIIELDRIPMAPICIPPMFII